MKNPISETKSAVRELLLAAVGQAIAAGVLPAEPIPDFTVEIPADRKNGDFASNIAMVSARAFHLAPRKIAEAIVAQLHLEGSVFARAEIAGPGFINFYLSAKWYADLMQGVEAAGDDYGRTDYGAGKRVLVEFVSANPTGPMHIGNARGGALGDGIAAALEWAGYEAKREFYLNDAGNQINKFANSLELRYLELYNGPVEMPEDSYKGQDIVEHAKNFAAIHGDAFVNTSSEERRKALVDYALPLNVKGLEEDLKKYRIVYDNWFKESTLHANGAVAEVIRLFKEKGCTYESEGALWFKATEFGADQDFVLVRSNGVPTYVVPDIAYHYNKLAVRGFDKAIDVLGADHHGYVPRLKASLQALGIDPNRLEVVIMQMVRLVRGTEIVKASKRSGTAITLATLIEEVPIDAARFYFNLREANSHFDFDLDLAVEESSQNPVYYVQYAHARICSIFRNLASEGILPKKASECDFSLLTADEELALMQHIASLPNEIIESAKAYDPTRITRYCLELGGLFHKFYNACRVKCDDEALMAARLCLCGAVRTTLHNAMHLLKIETPETM